MKKPIIFIITIFFVTTIISCDKCNPTPPPIERDSILNGEWIIVSENFPDNITCLYSDYEEYPNYEVTGLLYIGTDNGLYTYNDTIIKKITNFTGKVYSIEKFKENIFIAMSDVFYNNEKIPFALLKINKNNEIVKIYKANDTIYSIKKTYSHHLCVGGIFDTIDNVRIRKFGYLIDNYWDTVPNLNVQRVGQIYVPDGLFLTELLPSKVIAYSDFYDWYNDTLTSEILCATETGTKGFIVSFADGLKLWDKRSGFYNFENPPQTKATIKGIIKQKNRYYYYCYIPEYQADTMIYIWDYDQWFYIIMEDAVRENNDFLCATYYKRNLIIANKYNPKLLKFIFEKK